jgi:hypothetical protein
LHEGDGITHYFIIFLVSRPGKSNKYIDIIT